MPIKKCSVEFDVYTTPDDDTPTCALRFPYQVCEFLYFDKFGTIERCYNGTMLDRRFINGEATGYLIPHVNCPFWGVKRE